MGDDERGIDVAFFNLGQQRLPITLDMGLPAFDRQSFVHRGAKRHLVDQTHINSGNGERPSFSTAHNSFPQHVGAIGSQLYGGLHIVKNCVDPAGSVSFSSDRIDTTIWSAALSHGVELIVNSLLRKVNSFRFAVSSRHLESLRYSVNGYHPT